MVAVGEIFAQKNKYIKERKQEIRDFFELGKKRSI